MLWKEGVKEERKGKGRREERELREEGERGLGRKKDVRKEEWKEKREAYSKKYLNSWQAFQYIQVNSWMT